MDGIRKIFFVVSALISNMMSFGQNETDSVLYAFDSVRIVEPAEDCQYAFFDRTEKLRSVSATKLLTKEGKLISITSFVKSKDFDENWKHGVKDLDHDGKNELILFNHTGGAHCCDEFYFFKNIASNKYQYIGQTFGGDVCISGDNEFIFYFHQSFGYFFTCYACGYQDETDGAPLPVASISFRYRKGKLIVEPGDKELKSIINDNLSKLGEQPYQKLEEDIDQDNGLRKEFGKNLVVYYYSFGKNLPQTQGLFNKYYKYPDAKQVWSAFVKQLQYLKKENSF